MTRRSKSERKFEREMKESLGVLNSIDRGSADHLFADAETKAAVRKEWEEKAKAAVEKFMLANPGQFYEMEDGSFGALPEGANIIPLRGPERA
jgi:hypothetical protein